MESYHYACANYHHAKGAHARVGSAKTPIEDTYMRIAIIGTAGRRGDADRITLVTWSSMIADARQRVEAAQHSAGGEPLDVTLASGGAAYADYLAVLLWRECPAWRLELFLPAPLGREGDDARRQKLVADN
jgi:hypothetical protein